ncbi:MAG: DUF1501 domain-containing protein [Singulisphaera sp.]
MGQRLAPGHLPGHAVPRRGPLSSLAPRGCPTPARPSSASSALDRHRARSDDSRLSARVAAYELPTGCNPRPEAIDLPRKRRDDPLRPGRPRCRSSRRCLRAWRLVGGRAVRPALLRLREPVGCPRDIEGNHGRSAPRATSLAGLITDLKAAAARRHAGVRGEFGSPMNEKSDGRDHNPYGFSMFMAGGGVKAGVTRYTDELASALWTIKSTSMTSTPRSCTSSA